MTGKNVQRHFKALLRCFYSVCVERDEARAEVERWRNAHDTMRETVKKLLLSRDASWTGGNDWLEAVDEAVRALGMEPDDDQ